MKPFFPIMSDADGAYGAKLMFVPWALIAQHEGQALQNHSGQDLLTLAERGGLGESEAVAVIEDRRWRDMSPGEARKKLRDLVDAFNKDVIRQIEVYLENAGDCDDRSCLLWGHIATLLRQSGYAQGDLFNEHFKGTNLE